MILAAGRGQRLSPLTDTIPKPLIEVAGRTLIEYQLSALKKAGVRDVVINTGWLGQKIIKALGNGARYGVRIEYSVEPQSGLETGGGIFQALPLLGKEPFLVVNADIYHQIPLEGLIETAKSLADNTLVHLLMVENPEYHPNGDFVLQDGYVLEKQDRDVTTKTLTYSGIGIYRPELFVNCSAGSFSSVPHIRSAIKTKQVSGEHTTCAWFDAGTIERIKTIENFIASTK